MLFFFFRAVFSSPPLTELEINFQPFLFQSLHFSNQFSLPFVFIVNACTSLYRSTDERAGFLFCFFSSRAEFTLSSLALLLVIICCHFSLLWERYIHLLWKVFQTLTFGIFCCLSLIKAFKLMSQMNCFGGFIHIVHSALLTSNITRVCLYLWLTRKSKQI